MSEAARWAEFVANNVIGSGDDCVRIAKECMDRVPEEHKEEVKRLLEKLVNGPLPPIVHRNFRWDNDKKDFIEDKR